MRFSPARWPTAENSPRLARLRRRLTMPKALRNPRTMLALTVGVPLVLVILFGNRGVVMRLKLARDRAALTAQIAAEHDRHDRLAGEIARLRSDPATLDRAAREKYGMARDGEIVYKLHPVQE